MTDQGLRSADVRTCLFGATDHYLFSHNFTFGIVNMMTVGSVELTVCVPFIAMPTITDDNFSSVSLKGINSLSCMNTLKESLRIGLLSF